MARPRSIMPSLKYSGELSFWADSIASIKAGNGPLIADCKDRNQAISLRHKLNMARAYIRDENWIDPTSAHVGDHPWNQYTVKMEGLKIFIDEKQGFPWAQVRTTEGLPHDPTAAINTKSTLTNAQEQILKQVMQMEAKKPKPTDPLATPTLTPQTPATAITSKPPPPPTHDLTKPLDIEISDE